PVPPCSRCRPWRTRLYRPGRGGSPPIARTVRPCTAKSSLLCGGLCTLRCRASRGRRLSLHTEKHKQVGVAQHGDGIGQDAGGGAGVILHRRLVEYGQHTLDRVLAVAQQGRNKAHSVLATSFFVGGILHDLADIMQQVGYHLDGGVVLEIRQFFHGVPPYSVGSSSPALT